VLAKRVTLQQSATSRITQAAKQSFIRKLVSDEAPDSRRRFSEVLMVFTAFLSTLQAPRLFALGETGFNASADALCLGANTASGTSVANRPAALLYLLPYRSAVRELHPVAPRNGGII